MVEFRHSSWCEQVYTQLKKNKISFCGHSYPGLPDDFIITTTTAYYRLHGLPDLYYSAYSNETLKRIADIGLNKKSAKQVYYFFNNTATVGAIKNALWLKQYVGDHLQL